jgi:hypothetical protein
MSADAHAEAFDLDGYLSKRGLEVLRRKPWQSHPGGWIYELAKCPFEPDHVEGSAAFTVVDGNPGFRCQHDGCRGRTIKDIFELYPPGTDDTEQKGDSASGTPENGSKRTQSQILVEIAAGAELFHTPGGEAFAFLDVRDHREVWPVRSKGFRQWLTRAFYKEFRKPPGSQGIQDAVALLEAKARFDSPERQVFTRIAPCSDSICIDLCNENWEAVIISPAGWRVVQNPPVCFRRTKGMQALPCPAGNGSLAKLRSLLNIGDNANWILLLSWLVAACRPQGPYPVLIFQGEQGSAKSTTARLVRKIIDPVIAPLRTPPREERDLLIAANNSWVVAFDNVSGIPHWLSDALCRLATGGGFSTRELYTDSEEVILDLTRPVILNGIDHLAERADLADRAIILNLPRIEDHARREEAEIYTEYERELPLVLGALFTAVSRTLARLPQTELQRKPRMADFAVWATAAEEPLGFERGAFMAAYGGNRAEAVQETIDGDAVSAAVVAFTDHLEEERWTGTSRDLLERLTVIVGDSGKKATEWPKSPRGLSSRLRRAVTLLREAGIEITFHRKGTGGQRRLTIARTARDSTATTAATAPVRPVPFQDEASASGGPGLNTLRLLVTECYCATERGRS